MEVLSTKLAGVLLFEPKVFSDSRGCFFESWNRQRYQEAGLAEDFVQDNLSISRKGVLRGLHYQHPHPQGKLVQVLEGEVLDVAVDIRRGSPTFGQWLSVSLSAQNRRQIYIPGGFAHGFAALSETVIFSYKCTDYYHPGTEGGILWNDPDLGICWPVREPLLSPKDSTYPRLKDIPADRLPLFEEGR